MSPNCFSDGWHAYGLEPQPFNWQAHFDLAHAERTGWRQLGPIPPAGFVSIPDPLATLDLASVLSNLDGRNMSGRPVAPTGEPSDLGRSASSTEAFGSPE